MTKAQPMDDIVQAAFQERQERLACVALATLSLREIFAELAFQNSIIMLNFLLFPQMNAIVGRLATANVHTRRRFAAFDRAFSRITSRAFEE